MVGRPRRRRASAALAATALVASVVAAGPAVAQPSDPQVGAAAVQPGDAFGYRTLFDGSQESFDRWDYAGDGGFDLTDEGTMVSRAGDEGGFGTLWYPEEEFGDFSLKLEFRDDAPGDLRANSGVQVRFPPLDEPIEECPTTFDGNEMNNLSWIAVNCGHEIQILDSPDGGDFDPRKTGSIYGFQDLDLTQANPVDKGVWSEMEIRVVGQTYTVIRDGEVINVYENEPGVFMEGRPNDPPSDARGLVGHVGVQAHGAPEDVISFRNVRIRELGDQTTVCDRLQGGATFPDVQGLGLRSFIDCLAEAGVVEGKTDGTYDPRGDVTRGQLASFAVRAIETAAGETLPTGDASFPDVAAGSTHGSAILKLREAGIVQGYPDGTFRPAASVTREQTARYVSGALELLLGEPLPTSGAGFDDVTPGSQFAQDIDRLATAGIVDGYGDGTFGPRDAVSRAQMAKFVANALEVVAAEELYLGP